MGIISGILGAGASIADAKIARATAKDQYNYQRSLNQQQDDYNTQMSNTQYQRGTADMLKAGLNPALMFKSGGPDTASASSGGNAPDVSRAVGHPVSSALHNFLTANQAKQVEANTDTARATADKTQAEASLLKANTANTLAKTAQEVHSLRASQALNYASRDKLVQTMDINSPNAIVSHHMAKSLQSDPMYGRVQAEARMGGDLLRSLNPFRR